METQARNRGRRGAAWSIALAMLVFTTSACGQTSTSSEENADDAPPANAPQENAPAEDQGEDQTDDQDDAGSDDQAEDQGDDSQKYARIGSDG